MNKSPDEDGKARQPKFRFTVCVGDILQPSGEG